MKRALFALCALPFAFAGPALAILKGSSSVATTYLAPGSLPPDGPSVWAPDAVPSAQGLAPTAATIATGSTTVVSMTNSLAPGQMVQLHGNLPSATVTGISASGSFTALATSLTVSSCTGVNKFDTIIDTSYSPQAALGLVSSCSGGTPTLALFTSGGGTAVPSIGSSDTLVFQRQFAQLTGDGTWLAGASSIHVLACPPVVGGPVYDVNGGPGLMAQDVMIGVSGACTGSSAPYSLAIVSAGGALNASFGSSDPLTIGTGMGVGQVYWVRSAGLSGSQFEPSLQPPSVTINNNGSGYSASTVVGNNYLALQYSGSGCTSPPIVQVTLSTGTIGTAQILQSGICPGGYPTSSTAWTPIGNLVGGSGVTLTMTDGPAVATSGSSSRVTVQEAGYSDNSIAGWVDVPFTTKSSSGNPEVCIIPGGVSPFVKAVFEADGGAANGGVNYTATKLTYGADGVEANVPLACAPLATAGGSAFGDGKHEIRVTAYNHAGPPRVLQSSANVTLTNGGTYVSHLAQAFARKAVQFGANATTALGGPSQACVQGTTNLCYVCTYLTTPNSYQIALTSGNAGTNPCASPVTFAATVNTQVYAVGDNGGNELTASAPGYTEYLPSVGESLYINTNFNGTLPVPVPVYVATGGVTTGGYGVCQSSGAPCGTLQYAMATAATHATGVTVTPTQDVGGCTVFSTTSAKFDNHAPANSSNAAIGESMVFEKTAGITITGGSSDGVSTLTLDYSLTYAAQEPVVGSYVTISGATPSAWNGSWQVASATTSNLYLNSATPSASWSSGGTITPTAWSGNYFSFMRRYWIEPSTNYSKTGPYTFSVDLTPVSLANGGTCVSGFTGFGSLVAGSDISDLVINITAAGSYAAATAQNPQPTTEGWVTEQASGVSPTSVSITAAASSGGPDKLHVATDVTLNYDASSYGVSYGQMLWYDGGTGGTVINGTDAYNYQNNLASYGSNGRVALCTNASFVNFNEGGSPGLLQIGCGNDYTMATTWGLAGVQLVADSSATHQGISDWYVEVLGCNNTGPPVSSGSCSSPATYFLVATNYNGGNLDLGSGFPQPPVIPGAPVNQWNMHAQTTGYCLSNIQSPIGSPPPGDTTNAITTYSQTTSTTATVTLAASHTGCNDGDVYILATGQHSGIFSYISGGLMDIIDVSNSANVDAFGEMAYTQKGTDGDWLFMNNNAAIPCGPQVFDNGTQTPQACPGSYNLFLLQARTDNFVGLGNVMAGGMYDGLPSNTTTPSPKTDIYIIGGYAGGASAPNDPVGNPTATFFGQINVTAAPLAVMNGGSGGW